MTMAGGEVLEPATRTIGRGRGVVKFVLVIPEQGPAPVGVAMADVNEFARLAGVVRSLL
jgi:hypothetical protein